jgi:hypothetical protein
MAHDVSTHSIVITGLDPVIHVLFHMNKKDVDGRVEPGHDECCVMRDFHCIHRAAART